MPETSTRRMEIGVAGVTFEGRQDLLAELHALQTKGAEIWGVLIREPENQYDSNAIQVRAGGPVRSWPCIGYVPKALAAKLAPIMDAAETVRVTRVTAVRIMRGEKGYQNIYGARIDVEIEEAKT